MSLPALPLRDLHEPLAPSLWPPAPGWWWLLAGVVIALVLLVARIWKRRLRRRNAARLFDGRVAAAEDPAARVAAMSELLRRAARRIEPGADRCEGEVWLLLLDRGLPQSQFSAGPGRLLADGAFRRDVDAAAVEALRVVARARFLSWMEARR